MVLLEWQRGVRQLLSRSPAAPAVLVGAVLLAALFGYISYLEAARSLSHVLTITTIIRLCGFSVFLGLLFTDSDRLDQRILNGLSLHLPVRRAERVIGAYIPLGGFLFFIVFVLFTPAMLSAAGLRGLVAALGTAALTAGQGWLGLVIATVAHWLAPSARRYTGLLHLLLRMLLAGAFIALTYGVDATGVGTWLLLDSALGAFALEGGGPPVLTAGALYTALVLLGARTVQRLSPRRFLRSEHPSTSPLRGISFAGGPIRILATLELKRWVRDPWTIRYTGSILAFFLTLALLIGRFPSWLSHGFSFMVLSIYWVAFLMCALPLRARGVDLSLAWFFRSLPVLPSHYIVAKGLFPIGVATLATAVYMASAFPLAGVTFQSVTSSLVNGLLFALAATSTGFFWGVAFPQDGGSLFGETAQVTGFALATLALFQLLRLLGELLTGGREVLPVSAALTMALLLVVLGLAIHLEQWRRTHDAT